jgi:hypothetical protein
VAVPSKPCNPLLPNPPITVGVLNKFELKMGKLGNGFLINEYDVIPSLFIYLILFTKKGLYFII